MKRLILFILSISLLTSVFAQNQAITTQITNQIRNLPSNQSRSGDTFDMLNLAINGSVTASGTNTYTATTSGPAVTSYTGLSITVIFTNGNTGASTLNLNSLGAAAITKNGTTALVSGDITPGSVLRLVYIGTNFQIQGNVGGSGVVTSVSGTTNRITSTGGTTPIIDISSSYVGQNSITTLGTIATGVWNGTAIGDSFISSSSNWNTAYNRSPTSLSFTSSTFTLTKQDASTLTVSVPTFNQNSTGTSAAWTTGRTLSITGDLTYTSPSFDGSGNVTAAGTLATVNSNVGSFGSATQTGTFTVNGKGLITAASNVTITPAVGSITGLGTGVATALAINTGSVGAFVLFNGALGTPTSGTLTNATGLPVSTGISGLGSGIATWLATPSSANLASALTDETGTGASVFAGSPAFTGTPTLGTLGYSDTGILWSWQSSTNSYNQIVVQNTNAGATASTNIILSNDQGTSSNHFTEVGINSSGFTGSGSFNIAGASYFDAVGGDAVFGTTGNNSMHLVTNSSTTDAMTISGAGLYTISSPVKSNTIGGTFTATANSDYHWDFNATITGRSSQTADYVYGTKVDNTMKLGSNTQKLFNFYSTVVNYANNGFTGPLGGSALFTGVVYINASGNPSIQGRAGIEGSTTASPSNGWIQIEDSYPGVQLIANGNSTDRWLLFTGVQTLTSGGSGGDLSFRCASAGASGAGDLFSLSKNGLYGFGQNSITQTLTSSANVMQFRHKYQAPVTTATTTNYFDFTGETYTTGGTNQTYNHFNANFTIALGSNTGALLTGYTWNPSVTASVSYTNYGFRSQSGSYSGWGTLTPNSTSHSAGSSAFAYVAKTANYTLTDTDFLVDCTSNSFTLTLPTAVGITGRVYVLKNSGSATTITIATTSSQTIDGASPGTIITATAVRVMSDGANWKTL